MNLKASATLGRLYTYQDLAAMFKVCAKQVYLWFRHRKKFKVGNTVRIPEAELEKFIEEGMPKAGSCHAKCPLSAEPDARPDRVRRKKRPVEKA